MDNQPYNMIYYDKVSHTLEDATYTLQCVSNSILRYKQTISSAKLFTDSVFANYIRYNYDSGIIYLSFPPQCKYITNIRNSANCKMVMYYDNQEILIKPSINLYNDGTITIIIYAAKNTTISFDVYLRKRVKAAL